PRPSQADWFGFAATSILLDGRKGPLRVRDRSLLLDAGLGRTLSICLRSHMDALRWKRYCADDQLGHRLGSDHRRVDGSWSPPLTPLPRVQCAGRTDAQRRQTAQEVLQAVAGDGPNRWL